MRNTGNMKRWAYKMLGQGLSAAFQSKPEFDFLWAAQLNYPQTVVGVDIFRADVVILDAADQADTERAVNMEKQEDSGLYRFGTGFNFALYRKLADAGA